MDKQQPTPPRGDVIAQLPEICEQARRDAGRSIAAIATTAGYKHERPIDNFERGRSRPRDLDRVIDAYATECDTTPIQIWSDAIDRAFDRQG